MAVAKEVDIVIICMLNLFLSHLNDNCSHKCIYNILSTNNKKDNKVVKMILEGIREEINNEEEIDKGGIDDQGLNREEEEIKERNKEDRDRHPPEIHH